MIASKRWKCRFVASIRCIFCIENISIYLTVVVILSNVTLNNNTPSVQAHELPDAIKPPIIEIPENINHFIEDPLFTYQDFSRRGADNVPSTFRVQDYSWDDHGFSLVNSLYSDVGLLLDSKFRTAYNLTYFTMADKTNVDTSKFRRAIWNYIQCIYGIRHDDYDYGEVNQVSFRRFKKQTDKHSLMLI